jgi:hypothetical protein
MADLKLQNIYPKLELGDLVEIAYNEATAGSASPASDL